MKFLAPVGRGPIDEAARTGEQVFSAIGCAACHVPSLQTGPSGNPLFHQRQVPLFSDLLLHDIGTGDGIAQGVAAPEEIRTPALWGLRFRRPFLHDGSAATLEETIGRHANEAELARRGYERAAESDRAALLAFLRSLALLLTDAVKVTERSHDDDAVGDRWRRHDDFLHVVLRDLRQPGPAVRT